MRELQTFLKWSGFFGPTCSLFLSPFLQTVSASCVLFAAADTVNYVHVVTS